MDSPWRVHQSTTQLADFHVAGGKGGLQASLILAVAVLRRLVVSIGVVHACLLGDDPTGPRQGSEATRGHSSEGRHHVTVSRERPVHFCADTAGGTGTG